MKLSHLFEIATSKLIKADAALQNIWTALKFAGFEEDDLPNISSATGGTEIFLEWRGCELHEQEIINIMESDAVITPDSFSTYSN